MCVYGGPKKKRPAQVLLIAKTMRDEAEDRHPNFQQILMNLLPVLVGQAFYLLGQFHLLRLGAGNFRLESIDCSLILWMGETAQIC